MSKKQKDNLKFGDRLLSLLQQEERPRKEKKICIGIAGEGLFLQHVLESYAALPSVENITYYHPDEKSAKINARNLCIEDFTSDIDRFTGSIDAVEVFKLPGGREDFVSTLLDADKYVSLQKPFATSLEEAESLIRAEKKSSAFMRVNEYALFYEPHIKLKELIGRMEIGEVCAARFGSNLCGEGGLGPARELLKDNNGVFHPAFDKAALALWLLGPVESVCSYQNAMRMKKGGQSIIGFKYRAEGCYGFFDNTFAPGAAIRTDGLPCDDSIEIAGTDGIIWVNHFHGKMAEEPWIEVRRGKKHFSLGIGSDMKLDWKDSLSASASHFVDCVSAGRRPTLNSADALRALRLILAAAESNSLQKEIKINTAE